MIASVCLLYWGLGVSLEKGSSWLGVEIGRGVGRGSEDEASIRTQSVVNPTPYHTAASDWAGDSNLLKVSNPKAQIRTSR